MNAGLPGTGLGGLFYLICAVLMPINEIILTLRGHSSRQRWLLVARQFGIAAGIIGTLAATYWLMSLYHLLNWTGHEEQAEAQVRVLLGLVPLIGAGAVVITLLVAGFLGRHHISHTGNRPHDGGPAMQTPADDVSISTPRTPRC